MRRITLLAAFVLARVACAQPVGSEFRANTIITGNQDVGAVAMDGGGGFVVAWRSQAPTLADAGVRGQRFDANGQPLGQEFGVTPVATQDEPYANGGVAVARQSAGDFVVAWGWAYSGGIDIGIFGQRFDAAGAKKGSEFRINTYTTDVQDRPSVGVDGSGNFVVAWESNTEDGSLDGVYARRYASSGAPQGSVFRVNTYTTGDQIVPAVAVTAGGDFLVAWTSKGQEGSFSVYARRFAASGAAQGAEFRVNTYTGDSYSGAPDVAFEPGGSFVVVWRTSIGAGHGTVMAKRFAAVGAPLGDEFRVNTSTNGYQTFPAVAYAGSGGFVVSWLGGPAGNNLVMGQRFAPSGALLGTEFRLNTTTNTIKGVSDIAANGNGKFVGTWDSKFQDGSAYGVYGQLFAATGPAGLRGDADGSGVVNVSDVLYLINHLFAGGPAPGTACAGDADASNALNVSDVLFLINYLFAGGPTPSPC